MRTIWDTNVLILGILFPKSLPAQALRYVTERGTFVLPTCVIEELYRVFQRKFSEKTEKLDHYLERREYELFVTPDDLRLDAMPPIRDAKDAPVLASAILADVDMLITGDKDFTDVKIDRPAILTPAAFLESIGKTPPQNDSPGSRR